MKKIKNKSKAKVIFDAFTEGANIDSYIHNKRQEQCSSCEHSSANIKDLNVTDRIRHRTTGSFCTICGCYISKKTGVDNQMCPLQEKGEKPKWFNTMLTIDGDYFRVSNLSYEYTSIELVDGVIIVGLWDSEKFSSNISFRFLGDNVEVVKKPKKMNICYIEGGIGFDKTKVRHKEYKKNDIIDILSVSFEIKGVKQEIEIQVKKK